MKELERRMTGTAIFDETGVYRYRLTRMFAGTHGVCTFIMLNPSTATAEVSDPTVRRCEGYASRWGYSVLWVVNIFALRSTDPKNLYSHADPVGPDNDKHIVEACGKSHLVVAAWGTHGTHLGRNARVLQLFSPYSVYCLGKTKDGHPKHPLYLKNDAELELFHFNGRLGRPPHLRMKGEPKP